MGYLVKESTVNVDKKYQFLLPRGGGGYLLSEFDCILIFVHANFQGVLGCYNLIKLVNCNNSC